ncbi:MAG: hypothetical protein SV422_01455 [Pseudomonadota bacterium]|nr:hypothetical protein [Pseudomonadota bacterium]
MRAERDDVRFTPERRNYTMLIVGGTVLILAVLLYIGLRDTDELIEETPTVVRDSAIVAPPVVDTPPPVQQQTAGGDAAADAQRRDFTERELPPPVDTVGAGVVAPAIERAASESLVIDGDLLEELEEDAQVRAGEASPDQLRTPQ